MIGKMLIFILAVAAIIFGISVYLSPDDLAKCDAVTESGDCRAADAIVVVSGGDTIARTNGAIQLYKQGWAPAIIFSGAAADKDGPSNANVMRQHAVASGVPKVATEVEGLSETTKQNAELVKGQLETMGAKSVILVTSGYHMRRTSLEFSKHLGSDIEIRRHPAAKDKQWGPLWWLTPWGWWLAISELAKVAAFYVGGSR